MDITALENLGAQKTVGFKPGQEEKMRQAAKQFEAVFLMQLTSALNTESSEDSLFGQDGGSDLAKKMFSEQMATVMSETGGVGLSEMILKQFGLEKDIKTSKANNSLSDVISAVKQIRNDSLSSAKTSSETSVETDLITMNPVKTEFSSAPKVVEFQMPLMGRISSKFGNRFHPIDKKSKFHSGVDIAAPRGTPISAAADGIVRFSGRRGGYGNMVIIEHADGSKTRYGHAQRLMVKEGQKVFAGDQIATVGSTGKATGPHLHFEIREGKIPIDPMKSISNVLRR